MHRYIRNIDMEKNFHADHKWANSRMPHTPVESLPHVSRNRLSTHQPSLRKIGRVVLVTNVTHGKNLYNATYTHNIYG